MMSEEVAVLAEYGLAAHERVPLDPITASSLLWLPILVPMLAACVILVGRHRGLGWSTVGASVMITLTGVVAAVVTSDGSTLTTGPLRADALTAVMLLIIGAAAIVATWSGMIDNPAAHQESNEGRQRHVHMCRAGVPLLLASASAAVLAGNLGLLWMALLAMTVATTFLIGTAGTRTAWEAQWKYLVLVSIGLALAGLGTVMVYLAAAAVPTGAHRSLEWVFLASHTAQLDPGVVRMATPLLLIGFGAAAGLVPLHSWLPDAQSRAPGPVAALISGCYLPVAMYALLRWNRVVATDSTTGFLRVLLLVVAVGSLVFAVSMVIAQRDYLRLLAYTSMQYMALAVFGLAIGTPLAVAAVLLHLFGHGLAKAVLFCGAGQLAAPGGSTSFEDLHGVLRRNPAAAGISALALAALLGFPPFSPFASLHALLDAGISSGLAVITVVVATTVVILFISVAAKLIPMFFGAAGQPGDQPPAILGRAQNAPLVLGLTGMALLGIFSFPLHDLLMTAGELVVER